MLVLYACVSVTLPGKDAMHRAISSVEFAGDTWDSLLEIHQCTC